MRQTLQSNQQSTQNLQIGVQGGTGTNNIQSNFNSNSIEEGKAKLQMKQGPNLHKAGSLCKRQNLLPQMQQRALKQNLVLCKVPLISSNLLSFQGVPASSQADQKQFQFTPQQFNQRQSSPDRITKPKSSLYDQVYFENGKLSTFSPPHGTNLKVNQAQILRQEFENKVNKLLRHKKQYQEIGTSIGTGEGSSSTVTGINKSIKDLSNNDQKQLQQNQLQKQQQSSNDGNNDTGSIPNSLRNSVTRYVRTQNRQVQSRAYINNQGLKANVMKVLDTSDISDIDNSKRQRTMVPQMQLFQANAGASHQKVRKSPIQRSVSDLQEESKRFQFGRNSSRGNQQHALMNSINKNKQSALRNPKTTLTAFKDQKQYSKKDVSTDRLDTRESTHDMKENINQGVVRKSPVKKQIRNGETINNNMIKFDKSQQAIQSQRMVESGQLQTSECSQIQDYGNQENFEVKEYGIDFFNAQLNSEKFKDVSFSLKIVMLLIQYNIDELPKLQRLSASWHTVINDALEEYTNKLENKFLQHHSAALSFTKSYNSATPITFCSKRGMRLDKMFQCEILNNPNMINKTLRLAYNFQYHSQSSNKGATKSRTSQRYNNEFRFDVVKKGQPRITWIHQSDELPTYSQNEIQMSPGDNIEVAVCLYNMNGLVDLDSLQWEPIEVFDISQIERNALTYNRDYKLLAHKNDRKTKVHCNINRICEIEDAVPEWIMISKQLRDQPKIMINVQKFKDRFNILDVKFNELDQHYNKITLQTIRRGITDKNILNDDIIVHVKAENEPILNEIKKRGVMFDRNKGKDKIQLRVGDILVVYNSTRIPFDLQPEIVFPQSIYNSKQSSQPPERKSSKYTSNQPEK